MKKYKIIALSVGGHSNKIYNHNDIVSADAFEDGLVDDLEKQGFIEEVKGEKEAVKEVVEETIIEAEPTEKKPKKGK